MKNTTICVEDKILLFNVDTGRLVVKGHHFSMVKVSKRNLVVLTKSLIKL